MTLAAIVDAGPLVAYMDRAERHHAWITQRVRELAVPLIVCEAVLAEAMHLLSGVHGAGDGIHALLEGGALRITFPLKDHLREVRALQKKYQDTPMSLADACIVRMSELNEGHRVLTLDSDFAIYRKNGRQPIQLICPPSK